MPSDKLLEEIKTMVHNAEKEKSCNVALSNPNTRK